jgi:hypothetical protein
MANKNNEGQCTTRPPFFDGSNYTYWKNRMKIFLTSQDVGTLKSITYGYTPPVCTNEQKEIVLKELCNFTKEDNQDMQTNAKAMNSLICAIDPNEFNKISSCTTAKEIWDKLEIIHEGTSEVKESRINMLVHEYELFHMEKDEDISKMHSRFTTLINTLTTLGKVYSMKDKVMKILRCLPRSWREKVTAILEARDLDKLTMDQLIGSLLTHEMTIGKDDEEERKEKQKGKGIALKSTIPEDSSNESDEEDEMALFARKFKKFVKWNNKGGKRFYNRDKKEYKGDYHKKDFNKGEPSKSNELTCFKCRKPGHMKVDCPLNKKEWSNKKEKKKAMLAAWGSDSDESSSSDEEAQEVANLCLMAMEEKIEEVNDPLNDIVSQLELQNAFDELIEEFDKVCCKNKALKKIVSSLTKSLETVKVENIVLRTELETKTSCNSILEREKIDITKKADKLELTLQKFTKGREMLDKILASQQGIYDKAGLGYKPTIKKSYQNCFTKAHKFKHKCLHCNRHEHVSNKCPFRYVVPKYLIWVPKTQDTNFVGPKID